MKPKQRKRDAGVLLVCVLVCMGIASTIVLASMRSSLRARRQMRTEIQLEQTRWLLEAGVVRAVRNLRADSEYEGETWMADQAIAASDRARVEIAVRREETSSERVRLEVVAQVSQVAPNAKPTRRSRNLVIDLGQTP